MNSNIKNKFLLDKKNRVVVIIAIVLLVVIGIVIGITTVYNNNDKNEYMSLPDIEYEVDKVVCESSVGKPGDEIQCYAYGSDYYNDTVIIDNSFVNWSITGLADINNNGLVTIKASDELFPDSIVIDVTASTGNNAATYQIWWNFDEIEATEIELDTTEKTLLVNEEFLLTATIFPEDATSKIVTWESSNPMVATVVDGKVTAISGGETTITATTSNGKSATCTVKVIVPVSKIELLTTSEKAVVGETFGVPVSILPENATDKTITCDSSDESIASAVATTDNTGCQITGKKAGEAIITVTTSNNISASFTVDVRVVPVAEVNLSKNSLTLIEGNSETITANVLPQTATNKNVTWTTSNDEVATVSNGTILAKSEGTATITVKTDDGSKTATCEVAVIASGTSGDDTTDVAVTEIKLSFENLSLFVGKGHQLKADILPSNATNKTVNWFTNNPSVATVSEGYVTAVGVGEALITARIGDVYGRCIVTVTGNDSTTVGVAGLILDKTNLSLKTGSSSKLNVTINPNNATNKNVYWSSNDSSIVSVDQEGNIKALKSGTAIITVNSISDTTKYASCVIMVTDEEVSDNNVSVTNITLNNTKLTMNVEDKYQLLQTIIPTNATNQNVIWNSSDKSVATVSDGIVHALKEGNATITVTTVDGSKTATCTVTVTNSSSDVILSNVNILSSLSLSEGEILFFAPETTNYNITVPLSVNSVTINSMLTDSKSKYVDGYGNRTVGLNNTDNVVLIKVKAENGDVRTYTLNIKRVSDIKEIVSDITVEGYDIKFNNSVKEYNLKIKNEKSLDFNVTLTSDKYTYSILNNEDLINGKVIIIKATGDNIVEEYRFNISTTNIDVPITSLDSSAIIFIGSIVLGMIGFGIICFVKLRRR